MYILINKEEYTAPITNSKEFNTLFKEGKITSYTQVSTLNNVPTDGMVVFLVDYYGYFKRIR